MTETVGDCLPNIPFLVFHRRKPAVLVKNNMKVIFFWLNNSIKMSPSLILTVRCCGTFCSFQIFWLKRPSTYSTPFLHNWTEISFYFQSTHGFYSLMLKTVPRSALDGKTDNTPRWILAPPLGLCTNLIGLAHGSGRSHVAGLFCFYYQLFVGIYTAVL